MSGEARRREVDERERRRGVLIALGLLSRDGIPIRRTRTDVERESARLAGIDIDETGRVR